MIVLLLGCAQPTHPFPDGFLWGAATAGFQSDMGCPTLPEAACTDPASDWYQWVTTPEIIDDPGLHVTGQPLTDGPGMWELHEEDVRQMRRSGLTSYRMSIEWSRLFPDGAAETASTVGELAAHADPTAVARYHEMFAALHDAGIRPMVTLNHYTLPLWVHDGVACHNDLEGCGARGWVDAGRIVPLIALYAGFVGREFGAQVDTWATLNEPTATVFSGYALQDELRSAPPGLTLDGASAKAVFLAQIEGSAAMYDALHAEDTTDADGDGVPARVGLVINIVAIAPADPSREADQRAAAHLDYLWHRLFLDGLTAGSWDPDLDGVVDETRPDLADRLDWIGVNYYTRVVVTGLGFPIVAEVPIADFIPGYSFDPYPEGMAEAVGVAAEYGLPIEISENGTPEVDLADGILVEHLVSLHEAIAAGADVRGYHYWTWVDNYEWNMGFDLQLGLNALDPITKERLPRPALDVLSRAARRNGPTAE